MSSERGFQPEEESDRRSVWSKHTAQLKENNLSQGFRGRETKLLVSDVDSNKCLECTFEYLINIEGMYQSRY